MPTCGPDPERGENPAGEEKQSLRAIEGEVGRETQQSDSVSTEDEGVDRRKKNIIRGERTTRFLVEPKILHGGEGTTSSATAKGQGSRWEKNRAAEERKSITLLGSRNNGNCPWEKRGRLEKRHCTWREKIFCGTYED